MRPLFGSGARGPCNDRFRKPKRPSTIINDEGRVFRHIVPLIGKRVASDVTRAIVQHMADAIAAGKTAGPLRPKRAERPLWRAVASQRRARSSCSEASGHGPKSAGSSAVLTRCAALKSIAAPRKTVFCRL